MSATVSEPILHGDDPLDDLQRAIIPALADALEPVPVLDYIPEQQEPPYVTWGTAWLAERDSLSGCADRVWFQLDVWSDYRGYAEAISLARRVVRRLHHAQVRMPGYDTVHLLREQAHETRDPDGRHRRIALTFHSPYVSPLRERPKPPEPEPEPGSYAEEVLADAPLAYYRLGDSGGEMADEMGGDAAQITGALEREAGNLLPRYPGQSTRFAGYPSGHGLSPANRTISAHQPVTFEAWIELAGLPPYGQFGAQYLGIISNGNGVALAVDGAGHLIWLLAASVTRSSVTLELNRPYHVAGMHQAPATGAGFHLFVDGADVTGEIGYQAVGVYAGPIMLGQYWQPTYRFAGRLQELAIYNKTLSPERILAHHQAA